MKYKPTRESVSQHPVPEWFQQAKLGIFIHWGLYSVPAWAPLTGELNEVAAEQGWATWFANNPYAEWYLNTLRIEGSPTYQHHIKTYGQDLSYDDFVPLFNEATQKWNPGEWADLIKQAGARYAVLTTKHHDGFLLWPSRHPNPFKKGYFSERDLVGELTEAVRAQGLKMALYYSGGIDWTFNPKVVQDVTDIQTAVPQTSDYIEYATKHWRELIDRYQPIILWNDIAYPAATDLNILFADYYNQMPEGLVNDRFTQRFEFKDGGILSDNHYDFRTPEYASFDEITEFKWETTRGIGYSFGYNQIEGPENYLSLEDLIHSFVDIVSKNGNLLLNMGPMADGTIPDLQRERLLGLGQWLGVNGEAIFDTQPWIKAESQTNQGTAVRFTQKDNTLYVTLLDAPQPPGQVTIESLRVAENSPVYLLGHEQALNWQQVGENLAIILPDRLPDQITRFPAYTFKLMPHP
jgi:alpha-L-fucosidase